MATGGSLYDHSSQIYIYQGWIPWMDPKLNQVKVQEVDDDQLAINSIHLTQSFLESKPGFQNEASGSTGSRGLFY